MWQRYKLYLLAFVIYSIATGVLTVLALVAIRYDETAALALALLVTTLSSGFLGGFALVLGILRDDRVEKERQRAEKAEAAIADWQKRVAETEKRADHERNRADRAEAELQRVHAEYGGEMAERVRRLEMAVGITPATTPADADRSDRPAAQ